MNPGDERTRHHIQVLSDAGILESPITSWPLAWNNVYRSLSTIKPRALSSTELWSYRYLKHAFRHSSERVQLYKRLYISNTRSDVTDFSSDNREAFEAQASASILWDHLSAKIHVTQVHDPIDDKNVRLDGSYLAAAFGNWVLGVGQIDRWWGPSWQNSLILSHNSRPSPGLFIQRNSAERIRLPLLKQLGPLSFTAFANQLESHRSVAKTKLLGMRVSFKPIANLEVGISRSALWGGKNQPEDLSAFWDWWVDNKTHHTTDTSLNQVNPAGNQLGGIDLRVSKNILGMQHAFFTQVIGDAREGLSMRKEAGLVGYELAFASRSIQHRLAFEHGVTHANTLSDDRFFNQFYEDSIYRSGYRYYGRPIGASIDNDGRYTTLRLDHFFDNGQQVSWQASKVTFNQNGSLTSVADHHVFGNNEIHQNIIKLTYKIPLSVNTQWEFGTTYYKENFAFGDDLQESGAHIAFNVKW